MGRDGDERERPSWSELDKRKDRPRSQRDDHPRGREARERQALEQRDAMRQADALFSGDKGGEQGTALATAVRDAHGSSGLEQACRDYVAALGTPTRVDLLAIFLDCGKPDLMLPALEQMLALKLKGRLEISGGLKTQLRLLTQESNDDIAGLSEDLLA